MNKITVSRIGKSLAMFLLLSSSLPFSLAYAETVEEVPTSETTISTMADDPLKDKTESTTDHVPTIEEDDKEETKTTTSETASTEETKTTESSTADSTKKKPKPKPFGGGIGPQTVNLIEGVDIDANFAQLLRTDKSTTNNSGAWSGFGKAQDQLTDDDMAALTTIEVANKNLTSLKGIEYAVNITKLSCDTNQLSSIDVSQNIKLKELTCANNQLTALDVDSNIDLTRLGCVGNQLTFLSLDKNLNLQYLGCGSNQLTSLNLTKNIKLTTMACQDNQITSLDVSQNTLLDYLNCPGNQLLNLDLTYNSNLRYLYCRSNKLVSLDLSQNTALQDADCSYNSSMTSLIVAGATALESLNCTNNQIGSLDVRQNLNLRALSCSQNVLTSLLLPNLGALQDLYFDDNKLASLDLGNNVNLMTVRGSDNQLTSLITSGATGLQILDCQSNELSTLDIQQNTNLIELICNDNYISDITFAYGLPNLASLRANNQKLSIPIPTVNGNQATVDILKTTAKSGLSATNGDVSPTPSFTYNDDKILMSNVTRASLSDKFINFSYDGTQLTEGKAGGTKSFSGTIAFFNASDLNNELSANKKKVNSGDEVEWTWKITSTSVKKAEDVHATLNLPAGLVIDPSSIRKNGSPATMSDMDGTNSHGDMDAGDVITFTFKTTASGNADEWLEAKGRLDWKDDTITSPYHNEAKGAVQILDDEQTYTPKDSNDIALQSVPISFDYGSHHNVSASAQTHHLGAANYQSNTNVVTDGFYTRVKDDRTTSTGWKLTAKLSEFRDSGNQVMPNGAGTSLKLENMTIERVTDRDTPQEVIDPTPSGADVPSSVTATETLVAGQATAKTLVHAQVNEGRETWQLRMPFDKVSLNVPANAGKRATRYKARLTWSLDDTL